MQKSYRGTQSENTEGEINKIIDWNNIFLMNIRVGLKESTAVFPKILINQNIQNNKNLSYLLFLLI